MNDILVVDDDMGMRTALNEALCRKGYRVDLAGSGPEALEMFHDMRYRLVISDMKMPGMDGVELMRGLKKIEPTIPVLLITAFGTVQKAVEAVKEGAVDFIQKPFALERLEVLVEKTLACGLSHDSPVKVQKGLFMPARSFAMSRTMAFAAIAANSDATVLISGESGTGKELVSRFIHGQSARSAGPFVAVNCASIPDGLLESELFGCEKGAFTGAVNGRLGKFEQANKGTILLDEVSEMDVRLQAKLLRVIQEREVERLGGKKVTPLDIRIIATTNRDLTTEVAEGRFREDLFYRLNIFPLHIPPLRERAEDIPILSEHFMARFSGRYNRHLGSISEAAMADLQSRPWQGNVRELENIIERSVLLSSGLELTKEHLLLCNGHVGKDRPKAAGASYPSFGGITIKDVERDLISRTLEDTGGNRTKAARRLGISIRTLRNKLKEYGGTAAH